MTLFFIADTHFGHARILEYEDRPFATVDEMNFALIERWNDEVAPHDTVFHVGDVAMLHKPADVRAIVDRLNGTKILIRGNHDRRPDCLRFGFAAVLQTAILQLPDVGRVLLTHIPTPTDQIADDIQVNVHGHIHSAAHKPAWTDPKHLCVSVEVTDYRPQSGREIMQRLEQRRRAHRRRQAPPAGV